MTTLKITIRVFPLPPIRRPETAIDVKEFTASVTRVFQEILPVLSEKGTVNVQCCLLPIL